MSHLDDLIGQQAVIEITTPQQPELDIRYVSLSNNYILISSQEHSKTFLNKIKNNFYDLLPDQQLITASNLYAIDLLSLNESQIYANTNYTI